MDYAKIGMTKSKYLETCKLLNEEVDFEKMPPDLEDFPTYIHQALDVFNCLPDSYSGGMEPIYSGKDYSALSSILPIFNIDPEDTLRVFRAVHHLDTRARKQALNAAKKKAKTGASKK